ncbi:hypothetical protein C1645_818525 [Glomus cerebriforme]|uniref:Uncharacterized protein n=1 Tax=Glomus cerebriforme TaxID=658196 RepID=A0A397T777_9GLOM|nr:hypothetical protein C1645_818525 [Glomus cerebriforme]
MKKQDGFQYHVSSVNNCLFAINCHLNNKSILPKPINIMDKDQFYKLWQVFNGKVKNLANQGLGECNGSDDFTKEELLKIINHPAMSDENPTTLYVGKTNIRGLILLFINQKLIKRGANNIEFQADKLYILEIPSIIEIYENYFSKWPIQVDSHFYLQSCNNNEEQELARYERPEAEQPTLQENFIIAKSLFEDKNKVVDLPNNDTEIARKLLQDFNKIQEK